MTEIERRAAPPPLTLYAGFMAFLIAALWGGTTVAIRYSVDELPPVLVAGWRFLFGALFLLVWCKWEGSPLKLRAGQFRPCAIAGVMLFVQISLYNVGVKMSNSSHGSLFINTFVFWVIAIEHYVTHADRLTSRRLFGVTIAGVSLLGLLLSVEGDSASVPESPTLSGDLVLCLSGAILGAKVVWMKESLKTVEATKLVFWHNAVGVVLFFAWSFAFETQPSGELSAGTIWGVLYQGIVVAGFCFGMQAQLLKTYSASQITVFAITTPLFGVAAGVIMRGDPMSVWLYLAAAGIVIGLWLANRRATDRIASDLPAAVPPSEPH